MITDLLFGLPFPKLLIFCHIFKFPAVFLLLLGGVFLAGVFLDLAYFSASVLQ